MVVVAALSFFEKESLMLASTLLALFGLGTLGWIAFNLAVYALPFAIGMASGLYVYETGNGAYLAVFFGLLAGAFVIALGKFAFERARRPLFRLVIGFIYAAPAGMAGFHAAKGLSGFGGSGDTTIMLHSWVGALIVGGAAWARVSGWAGAGTFEPHPLSQLPAENDRTG